MADGRSPKSPSRVYESSGKTKTEIMVDDDTLQQMIETFGPLEYSEFMALRQGNSTDVNDSPNKKQESLMEWFDRSVENELEKRRELTVPTSPLAGQANSPKPPLGGASPEEMSPIAKHALNLSKGVVERLAQTSASRSQIATDLRTDFTTELTDAVDKLAEAEMMCSYAEALQAAEDAAQNAPPELVEQAARAGAQRIESRVTKVKNTIPGVKPIEVVGYVGITQPKLPKKN